MAADRVELVVPARLLGPRQLAGLRQNQLTLHDGDEDVAGVDSGAGLGSPAVWLWARPADGRSIIAIVDVRDLLASWARTRQVPAQLAPGIIEAVRHA